MKANAAAAIIGHNNPPSTSEVLAEKYPDLTMDIEQLASEARAVPQKIADDTALGRAGDTVRSARKLVKRIDETRAKEKEPHLTAGREIDGYFKSLEERVEKIARGLEERATEYQRHKAAEERRKREELARRAAEEAERQREIAAREAERNRHNSAAKHEEKASDAEERAREAAAAAQASTADLTRVRTESGTVATTRTTWDFEIVDYDAIPLEKLRPYLARPDVEKAIRAMIRVNKGSTELAGVRVFENSVASFR